MDGLNWRGDMGNGFLIGRNRFRFLLSVFFFIGELEEMVSRQKVNCAFFHRLLLSIVGTFS